MMLVSLLLAKVFAFNILGFMRVEPGEIATHIRFTPRDHDRLEVLRYLTDQRSRTATMIRLLDRALIENPEEIAMPAQPDSLDQPRIKVFTHVKGDTAAKVIEGCEDSGLTPARFILHVVGHSLDQASQQIPEIDIIAAIGNNASVQSRLEAYGLSRGASA